MLRNKSNPDLFLLYQSDLILRVKNARNLENERRLLARFAEYLNGYPPSPELAKGFLARFAQRKTRTLARYSATIKSFMKWYGEPMDDFKVKIPRSLPPYTEDSDIEKLFQAIEKKKTHKSCIVRDALMTAVAHKTGMRRGELANLEPGDIHSDFLVVRHGKGDKDRVIPLTPALAIRLENFTRDMTPTEKVFKLKPPSISMKIKKFARKAGLDNFHTHSLRHKFATDLLERGANLKQVQELLGHENIATTEVYLSLAGGSLRQAINLLDGEQKPQPEPDTVTLKLPRLRKPTPEQRAEIERLERKLWPELFVEPHHYDLRAELLPEDIPEELSKHTLQAI